MISSATTLTASLPLLFQGGNQKTAVIVLVIGFLILSLALHEYGHAWVAFRCGDTTARDMGRLTLNPIAHIDPIMTVLLPVFLFLTTGFIFGGAKPVPVASWNLRKPLRDMMFVALAGPAVNLILAFVFGIAWKLAVYVFEVDPSSVLAVVLKQSVRFNVLLTAFNMIPIPPLDGSRVLAYLLPASLRDSYQALERFGMIIVFALIATGMLYPILIPAMRTLETWVDTLTGGIWTL